MARHSSPPGRTSVREPSLLPGSVGARDRIVNLLMLLTGIWLLVASWPLRYPFSDAAVDAQRNETGVGLLVVFIAGAGMMRRRGMLSDLIILLLGLWMLLSPLVIAYGGDDTAPAAAHVNEIVTGIVLIALALVSMLLYLRSRRTGAEKTEGG
ncbi:hypothetical protein GCM10010420_31830 [Streptomyces glaucosporus]|uniref:SPW repeat-containing integral membrane domain-containing protein n=1 Tax=Streptomyces glaucosporus TaxID=284044 RepID=A0ABP5VG29_9ACTN